ncbi:MAG: hypothetical protein R6U95_05945 [Bacteroidales bacterium]
MTSFSKIIITAVLLVLSFCVNAQFYNGSQMTFGKNRVQYKDFFWRYFRYEDFDVYYDQEGRELAEYVAQKVPVIMQEVSQTYQMNYSKRIIFIVCNSLQDFKQTNIGLGSSITENNIGGVTQIVDNKVVVYFNGNHHNLFQQLKKGIAELYINNFLFGVDNYREIISNSTISEFPHWFVSGFIQFMAEEWTPEIESHIRNGVFSGTYNNMYKLQDRDAAYAGLALWNYISEVYGTEQVGNIVYLTGVIKDVNQSFELLLGKNVSQLVEEMNEYYIMQFSKNKQDSNLLPGETIQLPFRLRNHSISSISISPYGEYISYVTEKEGRVDLWVYTVANQKHSHIKRFSHKLGQITDKSYPSIGWHPSGKSLAYTYQDEGDVFFRMHVLETDELIERKFVLFDKVLHFSFSADGSKIVFTGVSRGQSDIYTYSIPAYKTTRITNIPADDLYPSFIQDDSRIMFTSNRCENNSVNSFMYDDFDMYTISVNGDNITRITNNDSYTELQPQEFKSGTYMYISNKTGIQSLYLTIRDSVIQSIDTAIHYTQVTTNKQVSCSNNEHVLQYDLCEAEEIVAVLQTYKGNKTIQIVPYDSLQSECETQKTTYAPRIQKYGERIDSTMLYAYSHDSLERIDYTDYNFDYEKFPYSLFVDSVLRVDSIQKKYETTHTYKTNFYVNQVVNQVDFGFMNASYQKFTGYEFQYVPRLNIALKFGVVDLFEDYRLTGGARFYGDLNSSELLFSLENLKERIDKQYVYHRQSLLSYNDNFSYIKTFDNHLKVVFSYPFDEVQSIRITPGIRYVKDVELSAGNLSSLRAEPVHEVWSEIKCEYVFDNTLFKGINLYNGTRVKVFAELFEQIDTQPDYLFVFGVDGRHYQKIHRNILFASRFAYSFSFGTSPLLYYLGGVDNWINISTEQTKFNNTIEYDRNVDWAYQAVGVNMRGFRQNIRNGPSFALSNNELRVPIVSYLFNRPISSSFFENLQIIGFFDLGAAWYGVYPGATENAYNYSVFGSLEEGPVEVEVEEMRSPFVFGYGYGIRSRLYGYFLRLDWAYGKDYGETQKMIYLSLSLDF